MRFALALAVLSAHIAAADPPKVTVVDDPPPPKWETVKAKVGRPVTLKADKPVVWMLVDEGAAVLTADSKATDTCRVVPYGVGCYRVLGFAEGDPLNPARVMVSVGDVPQPMPLNPPVPVPIDPLAEKLQAAFRADTPADHAQRVEAAKNLASFYKVAADTAAKSEADLISDVVTQVNKAAAEMVGSQLPLTRGIMRDELKKTFPADGPLTASARSKLSDLFTFYEKAARTLPDVKLDK